MAVEIKYTNICAQLTASGCFQEDFTRIKQNFQEDINSERMYNNITAMGHLIKILEKRDCLGVDNIEPLRTIAKIMNRNDIIELIGKYERQTNMDQPAPGRGNIRPEVLPEIPDDPVHQVYDLIGRNIGQKWKDFSRALSIDEGYIDELEMRYPKIYDIVWKVIAYHRKRVGEQYWRIYLCRALSGARRNDLREEVQELFARHHMM